MKEAYFTPESICQKSVDLLKEVKRQVQGHGLPFEPPRSALLVLDMQKYFLEDSSHAYVPSAQAIIPGIGGLIQEYAKRGLPTVFTRHVNSPQNAKLMAKWWEDLIHEENPLCQITKEFSVSNGIVLKKSQYDAFYDTPLEDILIKDGVSQVVVCGVMTHLCCESTARSAFMRGFEVFFAVDGTATYNANFHLATLLNLSHGFATPALVNELLTSLRKDEN